MNEEKTSQMSFSEPHWHDLHPTESPDGMLALYISANR